MLTKCNDIFKHPCIKFLLNKTPYKNIGTYNLHMKNEGREG